MDEYNIIKGKTRHEIFKQLQSKKIMLKIKLQNSDFKELTILTGLKTFKDTPCFTVDLPGNFKKVISNVKNLKLIFNFTDLDKIEYNFNITDFIVDDNEIWLKFPEFIERLQRRKSFRINAPYESKLFFKINSINYKFNLINISQGGALGIHAGTKILKNTPILKIGETIDNAELLFLHKEGIQKLHIKELTIQWVAKSSEYQFIRYGVEFTKIEKNEAQLLTKIIYGIQRLFLQRR